MKVIQSKLLRIVTYDVSKILLFCLYDKKYILDDDINTLVIFIKIQEINKTSQSW